MIEVMGLAVLPPRLKENMALIAEAWLSDKESIEDNEKLAVHGAWYKEIKAKHPEVNADNVESIIKDEIGKVFMQVLTDAGVFKRDTAGMEAFDRFVASCQ